MSEAPRLAFAALLFVSTSLHKGRRSQRSQVSSEQLSAAAPIRPVPNGAVEAYEEATSANGSAAWHSPLRICLALVLLGLTVGAWRVSPVLGGASAAALMLPGWYFLPWWRRTEATRSGRSGQWGHEGRHLHKRGRLERAAYLQLLQGSWVKDKVASDSMEPALHMVHLGRLMRSAVRLVKGIQLRVYDNCFEMAVFSVVPWFKVIERYPLTGSSVVCKRRDLRRGSHRGNASFTADGELMLALEWGPPYGGSGSEVYHLVDAETLHVASTMTCLAMDQRECIKSREVA
ncbi:hypothetical protein WJX73_002398 [Symbiochloris irregularis]|uniref:Uncharacterized protein n=1 Tax=Symbiochloris irregularis TaxID=706552 RepID=A0AAW1PEK6_9CHLO